MTADDDMDLILSHVMADLKCDRRFATCIIGIWSDVGHYDHIAGMISEE